VPNSREQVFAVGTARVEITPPLTVPYLGLVPRHCAFRGVHDPLWARVLHVSAGGQAVAILDADLIGFADTLLGPGRRFTAEIKAVIGQATGLRPAEILLAATHVHSAPDTLDFRPLRDAPGAREWLESLKAKLAAAVVAARSRSFSADLRSGRTVLRGYSRNRRGEPDLDEGVTVLRFAEVRGSRQVVLVNYACHPVIMQVQELVSGDFVAAAQRDIEAGVPGCEACLFLQGACGDINPRVDDSRNFSDVAQFGAALAGCVVEQVGRLDPDSSPAEPAVLASVLEEIALPSRDLPSAGAVAQLRDEARGLAAAVETATTPAEANALCERLRELEEKLVRVAEGLGPFVAPIQANRVGGSVLVALPVEPMGGMAPAIAERCEPLKGITVGFANGYLGYLAPPDMWDRGGYEVALGPWSKIGPAGYGLILEAVRRVVARAWAGGD